MRGWCRSSAWQCVVSEMASIDQSVMDVLDLLGQLDITQVGLATKPLTK